MITRMYVNNFRCLVAFKAEFDSFAVLCGPNGAGKSSVFDALRLLQNLGTGDALLGGTGEQDLPDLEFTDWLKSSSRVQEFELGLSVDGHSFDYILHIEQTRDDETPRIIKEHANCDQKLLFTRDLEGVEFEKADGTIASFPLDWRKAALANIQPRGASLSKVAMLQEEIAKLLILRPNPRSMERESKAEVRHPGLSMTNLTSWYRSLALEQEWTDALRDALQVVWPDFRSFKLVDAGLNTKALQLRFESEEGKPTRLFFDQLSDGERALIGLYMVRAALETGATRSVMLDEPDNFVGLPELQPWVLSMRELLDEKHQLVLISHHPEILSNSGEANGRYLWRDNHTSPTRYGPLRVPEGMGAGEAIARGGPVASRTQIVCLCEGKRGQSIDEVFINRLIKSLQPDWLRPWPGSNVIRPVPCGGRKELIEKMPKELKDCLAAGGHTTLMVWADCDDDCDNPEVLKALFWNEAQRRSITMEQFERVVFIFAKDRIENWIEFLKTGKTDESREGPRVKHNREAADAAKKLASMCKENKPVNIMPPSLQLSCKNWQALKQRMKTA